MSNALGALGPYRLLAVVGSGSFATVYRAHDDRLGVDVAIKVLADNHALDPDIRARFVAEGRHLRRADSRHLIQIHDVGDTDRDQPYLVLEYADRGTLADRVDTAPRVTADDIVEVASAIADAVGALHAVGLVHRDITPRNVLIRSTTDRRTDRDSGFLGPDERLILADLGLAKDLSLSSGLTVGAGTLDFAAPEQLEVGIVSPATDVFGFARTIEHLADAAPGAPWRRAVQAALEPAFAVDPTARPELDALVAAIRAAADAPAGDEDEPSATPTPTPSRRRLVIATVAALLVATVITIGVLAGRSPGPDRLEDGRVAVERTLDGSSVRLVGPDVISVGATGVFEAVAPEGTQLTWTAPDGVVHRDVAAIEVEALSPGRATVGLVATSIDGDQVELHLDAIVSVDG